MSTKYKAFYRSNKAVLVDFSAEQISSDGAVLLLEKLERRHQLLSQFSNCIPDARHSSRTVHNVDKLVKQRVFMLMQGYEDTNDVNILKHDPVFKDILAGELASQPTLSRFENRMDRHIIYNLCSAWVDRYVSSLEGRTEIIIDVDSTDDPTHGHQQLSLFHGYYGQHMYHQLFFHDGDTGQIILPVLRPGNSHSNRWFVSILKRIVRRIRATYPQMSITIRADSGFSGAGFYELADTENLGFVVGIASNEILKKRVLRAEKAVKHLHVKTGKKHQHFFGYTYQAKSWHKPQNCYAKVESTGKGLNTRHFVSNIMGKTARELYLGFYVKRGETSENRIKEVKNMCFADRLSNHRFWPNFFRLLLSSLAYEMFLLLKQAIQKTPIKIATKWCIQTIRCRLLKVGATIKKTKRKIYYQFSKAFVHQDLFRALITQK